MNAPAAPRSGTVRAVGVIAAILGVIAFNALANLLPLFGRATGEISAAYPSPFTPATYAFSIWGLLYLLQIVYAVWQAGPVGRADRRADAAAPWIVAGSALNVLWLTAWHADQVVVSAFVLAGLTLVTLRAYLLLASGPAGSGITLAARVPFAAYLGWLTAATLANATVAAWALGWRAEPFGADGWSAALSLVAAGFGLVALLRGVHAVYVAVVIWAVISVAVAEGGPSATATTVTLAVALLTGGIIGRTMRERRRSSA